MVQTTKLFLSHVIHSHRLTFSNASVDSKEYYVCFNLHPINSMFHVTWTIFKLNRNQLGTVLAYVI